MPSPSISRPVEAWAEVRSHDHVIRYRRAGVGRAVVLLRAAGGADPLWPELAEALAGGYRVLVPEVPADGADVAAWLGAFLEGLGATRVTLVAAEPFCVPALELALLDGGQLSRVVLVPGGRAGATGLDGTLATTPGAAPVPLLVVRRGLASGEALPLVARFLADHGAEEAAARG